MLVARGKDKLEDTRAEIEARGGQAHVYPCDLSDLEAIDALCEQLTTELETIDFIVNNAGRSIRRSLRAVGHDRFHDFERTMQLNYFGAIRLVMGLLPEMRAAEAATWSTSARSACRPTRRASRRTSRPRPRWTRGATW